MSIYFDDSVEVIRGDDGIIVCINHVLGISSQGVTYIEAKRNIEEAISLFLEYASDQEIYDRINEYHRRKLIYDLL